LKFTTRKDNKTQSKTVSGQLCLGFGCKFLSFIDKFETRSRRKESKRGRKS